MGNEMLSWCEVALWGKNFTCSALLCENTQAHTGKNQADSSLFSVMATFVFL